MSDLPFFLAVVASVVAIVDPVGALPFYVALTEGFSEADRQVILRRSVLVAGAVLSLFALFGRFLFATFGFTLQAFEIAGGILLFTVAYDMLRGEISRAKVGPVDPAEMAARRDEIAVVPLGIPLLAGPGAISTVMIFEGSAGGDPLSIVATFLAVAVAILLTYIVFRLGQRIIRSLGRVGVMVVTRVLGLVLAAVAVQFILNALVVIVPQL